MSEKYVVSQNKTLFDDYVLIYSLFENNFQPKTTIKSSRQKQKKRQKGLVGEKKVGRYFGRQTSLVTQ